MKHHLAPLLLAAGLAGCGGPHAEGHVALLVTDAPFPFENLHSASVSIDRIAIDAGPDSTGTCRVLYQGAPRTIELSSLRNGSVLHLVDGALPPGMYRRLFVHLVDARLELASGEVYASSEGTLALPNTDTQGCDLAIEMPILIEDDHWSRLLVDFDLARSFVPLESGLGAPGWRLEPLVHIVRPGQCGEIRGLVTQPDPVGGVLAVPNATISFVPAGGESVELAFATTSTDPNGSYTQLGLPPGSYDVHVQKSGTEVVVYGCEVSVGNYTLVDCTLP